MNLMQGSQHDRVKMGIVSVACLTVTILMDYATGYELVFSAIYLIPVAICAWHCGRRSVWLMSIATALATWLMDTLEGHPYSHFMFQYWNSFSCLAISLTTGLLLHRLRSTLRERKKANDELQTALKELQSSTEEIRRLQNGLQVVCAWTKRIKVGEQWMAPDEFLSTQLHLHLTHGISPEAYVEVSKQWLEPEADGVP